MYVKGLQGDLVAQWTREDATLRISGNESEESRFVLGDIFSSMIKPFCKDVTGDCGDYWKNRFESEFIGIFGYSKFFQSGVPTGLYKAFYFLLLLAVIYLVYPYFLKENLLLQNLGWKGGATPALILSLFVVTSLPGCGVLPGTGGKDGDPPWILAMGANVAPGVPSIQNSGVGMTGGGSVGGMPVTGMYFYHPNHLGSITMITDGAGNPASGPEPGVSYVSYEPYGSIIRNDSYGPDIFRYKFTGQIEDKETGLYYYKARYYEPTLGRFLQADSIIQPESVNGMNRYMYVDGNPVSYRDPSGHISGPDMMHMLNRIVGHAMGKDFNSKGLDKKLSTGGISKGVNRFVHNATFVPKGKYYINGTKLWDSTIGRYGAADWVKNNALYPGDEVRGSGKHAALRMIRTFFEMREYILLSNAKNDNERAAVHNEFIVLWVFLAPALAAHAGNRGAHGKLVKTGIW
ncbi:RHS repeat-associated core domain-containing protein (plasmid) [Leptospira interrogans]|nr:RHS repeat-associated core domain-containing protein [Leptospira interrogans]